MASNGAEEEESAMCAGSDSRMHSSIMPMVNSNASRVSCKRRSVRRVQHCRVWTNFGTNGGLEAYAKKSGIMIMRGSGGQDERPYIWGGENVPVVDIYKYLSVLFNSKRTWNDYVYKVYSMANRVEYRLWKSRAVDVKTKVVAWKRWSWSTSEFN